jgi:hypothetical protein
LEGRGGMTAVQAKLDGSVKCVEVDASEAPPCGLYVETKRNEECENIHANSVRLYRGVFWCFARDCSRWLECAKNGVKFYWSPLRSRHILIGGVYDQETEQDAEVARLRRELQQLTEWYR